MTNDRLVSLLGSALIGIFMGMFFLLLETSSAPLLAISNNLIISALIGVGIGSFAEFSIFFVTKNPKNRLKGYFTTFVMISIFTGFAAFFMGIRDIKYIIAGILLVQFPSIGFTYLEFRYHNLLNERLKETQENIRKGYSGTLEKQKS